MRNLPLVSTIALALLTIVAAGCAEPASDEDTLNDVQEEFAPPDPPGMGEGRGPRDGRGRGDGGGPRDGRGQGAGGGPRDGRGTGGGGRRDTIPNS